MANKMLIDAAHPEETRVVVLRGSRIEEFDFESENKKQLRGNIYLAKVTRVEPSLQAAFVEYGGNRHGFLAFSEIHPDYYQIPTSDRQALLDAEIEDSEEEERKPRRSRRRRGGESSIAASRRHNDEVISEAAETPADEGELHEEPADRHDGRPRDDMHAEESPPRLQSHVEPSFEDPTAAMIERADQAHDAASGEGSPPPMASSEGTVVDTMSDTGSLADVTPADVTGGSDMSLKHEPDPTAVETARDEAPFAPPSDADVDIGSAEVSSVHDQETVERAGGGPQDEEETTVGDRVDGQIDGQPDNGVRRSGGLRSRRDGRRRSRHDRGDGERRGGESVEAADQEAKHQGPNQPESKHQESKHQDFQDEDGDEEDEHVEHLGGDAMEEVPLRTYRPRRQYKIQEVIKRRQVLLVQVVKEERGNKGAALTTFLSLAGRYSVLMPNTARGGGISRKITDATDRQRLKSIAEDLEVPEGMGVILRTAGASRTKPEVKRDFEYLMRMWETVRETTLQSQAPTLVYEEGSLIKRSIRDLYNKDIEEIVVAGEDAYREAKDFMRLLMPSHAKNVQPWRDPQPIFAKAGAEAQLDAMFSSQVTLKSGGYLVINQTEALVAIDVNSGRSTREHNIEDTALRTNLEAADEVARQLRLRDLAGLIVIDFIDMEEGRNNRAVERRIKEALKNDRARIQIGRISHFGLMEMSRQRMRTGVLEGSTVVCEHCAGTGMMRSTSSIALHVLRLLEDALIQDASRDMMVLTRGTTALYILNQKRAHLADLEARFGAVLTFEANEHLTGTSYCTIERGEPATGIIQPRREIPVDEPEDILVEDEAATDDETLATTQPSDEDMTARDDGEFRRKRRRRRGRGRDRESSGISEDAPQPADDALGFVDDAEGARVVEPGEFEASELGSGLSVDTPSLDAEAGEVPPAEGVEPSVEGGDARGEPRRRRSRRGGRRTREGRERDTEGTADSEPRFGDEDGAPSEVPIAALGETADLSEREPVAPPATNDPVSDTSTHHHDASPPEEAPPHRELVSGELGQESVATSIDADTASAPDTMTDGAVSASPVDEPEAAAEQAPAPSRPEPVSSELDPARPKRSGWWSRAKATLGG